MNLLILPTQLFNKKYFPTLIHQIIIYEHPYYFTKYKFNKKKLILHRASMKYYMDYLIKNNFKVIYVEYHQKLPVKIDQNTTVIFDPIDKIKSLTKYTIIESPAFILQKKHYAKYRVKTNKFIFTNFYMWSKKEINLYPELKSLDKLNREKLPNHVKIPSIATISKTDKKYIGEAIKYVKIHFSKNYGTVDNFYYPISYTSAKKWLINFLKKKLDLFGPYQDFVNQNNNFMFHSLLSSSLNIGLLVPDDILNELKKYYSKVRINSFEGFLRQLFWREYQRYCFIYTNFNELNYFTTTTNKITNAWYKGNLGIPPIDDLIKFGFQTGYIHHIGRLMFIGNFMVLSGISPKAGFRWFMEFAIDSYEWVMYQNVMDMVFFVSGGQTMRRPYITSSNYPLKMSNYKKAQWSATWDQLYIKFLKKNKEKLWKFRYHFPKLKYL